MEPPKKMKTVEERRSEIRKSLQARKESKQRSPHDMVSAEEMGLLDEMDAPGGVSDVQQSGAPANTPVAKKCPREQIPMPEKPPICVPPVTTPAWWNTAHSALFDQVIPVGPAKERRESVSPRRTMLSLSTLNATGAGSHAPEMFPPSSSLKDDALPAASVHAFDPLPNRVVPLPATIEKGTRRSTRSASKRFDTDKCNDNDEEKRAPPSRFTALPNCTVLLPPTIEKGAKTYTCTAVKGFPSDSDKGDENGEEEKSGLPSRFTTLSLATLATQSSGKKKKSSSTLPAAANSWKLPPAKRSKKG